MGVYQRNGKGNWFVQFEYNGQEFRRSTKQKSKTVAKQLESKWRAELIAEQQLGQLKTIKLNQAIANYLVQRKSQSNHKVITTYCQHIANHFGNIELNLINNQSLEQFNLHLSSVMADGTRGNILTCLFGILKLAQKHNYKAPINLHKPVIPKSKGRLLVLSNEEIDRLLNILNPINRTGRGKNHPSAQDNYDLCVMLLDLGCRVSEASSLDWKHIDLEKGVINLYRPKVNNQATLVMSDRLKDIIQRRLTAKTTNWLFNNFSGKSDHRLYSSPAIKRAFIEAGIPNASLHTLRHTFATRMIENGLSILDLKHVLGHSDIKHTMRYVHASTTQMTINATNIVNSLNNNANNQS